MMHTKQSLKSKQRGFIINPYTFGGGSGPSEFNYATWLGGAAGEIWLGSGVHYQDSARTIISAVGDPVGSWTGSIVGTHASQATAAAKPLLAEAGGKRYLQFATDDYLLAGTNSVWNYLHNAEDAYVACTCQMGSALSSNIAYVLLSTFDTATATTGFACFYEGRTVIPAVRRIRTLIGKGTSGTFSLDRSSIDNAISNATDMLLEVIKKNNVVRVYVNGVQQASLNMNSNSVGNSLAELNIGRTSGGVFYLLGRIYGLLIANKVPTDSERLQIQADMILRCETIPSVFSNTADPYLCDTMFLSSYQGVDGSVDIVDQSPHARTVTVGGNAQLDTAAPILGSSALLLDGSGDYLDIVSNNHFDFSYVDFTIEFAFRTTVAGRIFVQKAGQSGSRFPHWAFSSNASGYMVFQLGRAEANANRIILQNTISVCDGAVHHAAAERNGNTLRLYIDGVIAATDTITITPLDYNLPVRVGAQNAPDVWYNGHQGYLRITRGVARYKGNYIPPTELLPAS